MTKANKENKGENEAVKRVRKSQEKIEFNGEILSRREVQKELNNLYPSERVWLLTQEKANRVSSHLEKYVDQYKEKKEELGPLADCLMDTDVVKVGASVFIEYRELLHEDSEGCGSDYDGDGSAFWVNQIWLKNLHRQARHEARGRIHDQTL